MFKSYRDYNVHTQGKIVIILCKRNCKYNSASIMLYRQYENIQEKFDLI